MTFPNRAGDHPDNDKILLAELRAAGIPDMCEINNILAASTVRDVLRQNSGEVKTHVLGVLHGWEFKRAWCYWMCKGPGIEVRAAERLYRAHKQTVRVAGHAGCPSPREWFRGLAVGHYHVDDADGLRALADTIREAVEGPRPGTQDYMRYPVCFYCSGRGVVDLAPAAAGRPELSSYIQKCPRCLGRTLQRHEYYVSDAQHHVDVADYWKFIV